MLCKSAREGEFRLQTLRCAAPSHVNLSRVMPQAMPLDASPPTHTPTHTQLYP